jgi:hypothetical protein
LPVAWAKLGSVFAALALFSGLLVEASDPVVLPDRRAGNEHTQRRAGPSEDDKVLFELHQGVGRQYPGGLEPPVHYEFGGGISAVLRGRNSRAQLLVGAVVDAGVGAWLGDEASTPVPTNADSTAYAGTVPSSRGWTLRAAPQLRLGVENEFAFGFISARVGYSLRATSLECLYVSGCARDRVVDHGLTVGLGLGVLFRVWRGLNLGLEGNLDSNRFFSGHPLHGEWNHGANARALIAWRL